MGHASRADRFAATIAGHGVVDVRRSSSVATAVTTVEAVLALAVIAEAVAWRRPPVVSLAAGAALFAGFAVYLAAAARRVGGAAVDCGCVGAGTITARSWLRPAGLSALAVTGVTPRWPPRGPPTSMQPPGRW